jgi:ubiquitin-activating enzyme E1
MTIIKSVDFEKDDDNLMHVDWITECANIRNYQYSIPITDVYETRKIAGNIIPAMITTTSLIAGFQILEYIKIIKYYLKNNNNSTIDLYKNRFVNLNINYCDGITPYKCEKFIVNNNELSLWTKIVCDTKIVSEIIDFIKIKFNKNIEFITIGNLTIYDGESILIQTITNTNDNIMVLIEDVNIPIIITFSDFL